MQYIQTLLNAKRLDVQSILTKCKCTLSVKVDGSSLKVYKNPDTGKIEFYKRAWEANALGAKLTGFDLSIQPMYEPAMRYLLEPENEEVFVEGMVYNFELFDYSGTNKHIIEDVKYKHNLVLLSIYELGNGEEMPKEHVEYIAKQLDVDCKQYLLYKESLDDVFAMHLISHADDDFYVFNFFVDEFGLNDNIEGLVLQIDDVVTNTEKIQKRVYKIQNPEYVERQWDKIDAERELKASETCDTAVNYICELGRCYACMCHEKNQNRLLFVCNLINDVFNDIVYNKLYDFIKPIAEHIGIGVSDIALVRCGFSNLEDATDKQRTCIRFVFLMFQSKRDNPLFCTKECQEKLNSTIGYIDYCIRKHKH